MRTLNEQLADYAAYHRDRRNVLTHMIGIPLIVLGVTVLASRPTLVPSPAMLMALPLALFYLRLELRLGTVMAVLLGLAVWVGHGLAAEPSSIWLTSGIGFFVVGWAVQLVGHAYEGRKPAFVDDLAGLAIGPLFIVAELAFRAGLRPDLRQALGAAAPAAAKGTKAARPGVTKSSGR